MIRSRGGMTIMSPRDYGSKMTAYYGRQINVREQI